MKINFKKYLIIAALSLFAVQAVSTVAAATAKEPGIMICSDAGKANQTPTKI